jgi:predicted esterase
METPNLLSFVLIAWSWFFSQPIVPALVVYDAPGSKIGVAWGNGTGGSVEDYEPFLRWLSEQGIVVVATTTPTAWSGDEIIRAAEALRNRGCTRIVAMGHSQGAGGALRAASRSPLFDAVVPIQPAPALDPRDLPLAPAFFVTGSLDELAPAEDVQDKLVEPYQGSVVHGTRLNLGHLGPTGGATEIRQYIRDFVLANPEFDRIFDDPNWKVRQ